MCLFLKLNYFCNHCSLGQANKCTHVRIENQYLQHTVWHMNMMLHFKIEQLNFVENIITILHRMQMSKLTQVVFCFLAFYFCHEKMIAQNTIIILVNELNRRDKLKAC